MDIADLAYFAAFIDGEGCIRVCGKRARATASLSVTNTYPQVLRDLESFFGGSIRFCPTASPYHLPKYEWYVYGETALRAVRTLMPYLRQKKDQAAALLAWAEWPRKSSAAHECARRLSIMKRRHYDYDTTT